MSRRTEEDFRKMSIRELHDEILDMSLGDGWDGMVSPGLRKEINAAEKVWEEHMSQLDKDSPQHSENELLEALKEIIKISDRKHDAWDRAKEIIQRIENQKAEQ